jgi:hypothetical protein
MSSSRFMPRNSVRLLVSLDGVEAPRSAEATASGFVLEGDALPDEGAAVSGRLKLSGSEYPFDGEVSWAQAASQFAGGRPRASVRLTRISNAYFSELRASPAPAGRG